MLGGDFVDERLRLNGQGVKPRIVYDASIIWEMGAFEVLGRVENLFDKNYAASGYIERTGYFPGDRRTFFVEAYYEWE